MRSIGDATRTCILLLSNRFLINLCFLASFGIGSVLPTEMKEKIYLNFDPTSKIHKIDFSADVESPEEEMDENKFWEKAIKTDFPAYKSTTSGNGKKEYRELYDFFGEELMISLEIQLLLKCMKPTTEWSNDNVLVPFLKMGDTTSQKKFSLMHYVLLHNRHFLIFFAHHASTLTMDDPDSALQDLSIAKMEDAMEIFQSKYTLNAVDTDYVKMFYAAREKSFRMSITEHRQKLATICPGAPGEFYNEMEIVPKYVRVAYDLLKERYGAPHCLKLDLKDTRKKKYGFIHVYENINFWNLAVKRDFAFYQHDESLSGRRAYMSMCSLFKINVSNTSEELIDKLCMVEDLTIEDGTCTEIADVLLEIMLRVPSILKSETETKRWAIPESLRKNADLKDLPTPMEYYQKKVKKTSEFGELLEEAYYAIKEEFSVIDFPENQVNMDFFVTKKYIILSRQKDEKKQILSWDLFMHLHDVLST